MSIITLLTRRSPTLAGLQFDAVLEDIYEASIEYTGYTLENGVEVTDHGIILPSRWRLIGVVSNNPLNPNVTDFALGAVSNFLPGQVTGVISAISAGFLAGSSETRASAALTALVTLMVNKEPFDVDAGDIQLSNMVITDLRRLKDTSNENGLVFEAELQELPTLDTIRNVRQPLQNVLRDGDPAKNQVAAFLDKGEQQLQDVSNNFNSLVDGVL